MPEPSNDARFGSTRWSLVAAARADDEAGRAALEELCGAYWYPLYAFARRSGNAPSDAADLTQDFFATLLEKGWLDQADQERGRFRTFLLAAFRHHASHVREKQQAKKRGGDRRHFSLDAGDAESRYGLEPAGGWTADRLYERRYALTLLRRAWDRLSARYRSGSPERAERYDVLRPYLDGDEAPPYRETATRLGISETAVKVAMHRLRGHFRDALRTEVADTVEDRGAVDDEIRRLMAALRS